MTLGYIISEKRLRGIGSFIEQSSDISLVDTSKPILIVGWKKAREMEGYSSILDKKLSDNVFWTFDKSEGRSEFEEDLKWFSEYIINNILNNIKYYYINIFKLKYSKIKKLYNIVYSRDKKTIYISNDLLYIPYEGNVLGISLRILRYCGISSEKVLSRIKQNGLNVLVGDDDLKISRLSKTLGNRKYALPYFLSS